MAVHKKSYSEALDDLADINNQLEHLSTLIKQREATPEQITEYRNLMAESKRAVSRIPQLVGNKSIIIH